MNAEQIARCLMTEDGTLVAPHLLSAKQLRILCRAVLDAAEYRKRVEVVTWMPLMGTGLAIRMDRLNEETAQKNHGQTLARLAERGGLDPIEALAIVDRRRLDPTDRDRIGALAKLDAQLNESRDG